MSALLLAAALGAGLSLPVQPAGLENGARIEPADCAEAELATAEVACGRLYPSGQSGAPDPVSMFFAVLRPHGERLATPILALPGGPGQPAGLTADGLRRWSGWLAQSRWPHDIVIFDLLGSGQSRPRLACPEATEADRRSLTSGAPAEQDFIAHRRAMQACRVRLAGSGIDIGRFGLERQLAAIDELLQLLGGNDWNYWGVSYGSRLAWHLAARRPGRVRSLLLDSVFPPMVDDLLALPAQMQRALDVVEMYCKRYEHCRADPEDATRWVPSILDELRSKPRAVEVWADPERVVLNDYRFAWLLLTLSYQSPYDSGLLRALPRAAGGDWSVLEPLLRRHVSLIMDGEFDYGAYYAVMCSDSATDIPARRWQRELAHYPAVAEFVWPANEQYPCLDWPAGAARPPTPLPDRPTLLLVGEFDVATLPEWAVVSAVQSGHAQVHVLPGAAHAVTWTDACAMIVAEDFLRLPGQAPLPRCLAAGR